MMGTITLDDGRSFAVEDSFGKLPIDQQQKIVGALKDKLTSGVAQDISKMSAGEIATTAIKNVPSSAANLAKDIVQPIIHPVDTATNIGKIGKGVMQKLGIMSGDDATPYADAVGKFLVDRYGSGEAIKKTITTDPVGVAADIATVLSGGELALARAPGVVGKVGEVAGAVGRAVDPLSAAGKVIKAGGGLAAEALGVTTGAGGEAIKTAARAGAEGGEAGKAFRSAMSGAEHADAIVQDARAAVANLRKERGDIYRKDMAKIGADNTVLKFDDIDKAVGNTVKTYKGKSISPSVEAVQTQIRDVVEEWKSLDSAEYHTAEGLDALKQRIGDIRDNTAFGTPQRVAADTVYNAIKGTIVKQAPDYAKVMKGYEEASNQIREIERTLSINPKASVDTAMRKILSALRDNVNTNYGKRRELVAFLARSGATHLLEKIAGRSLSSLAPRGLARVTAGGEGLAAVASLAAGSPALTAALVGGLAASSPALVGGAAYGAGAISRLPLRRLGQGSRLIGAATQQ